MVRARPGAALGYGPPHVLRRAPGFLLAAFFAFPVLLLVVGSLRPPGLAASVGTGLLPAGPSLDAFPRAFELQPLARQAANSLLVSGLAVPLSVVTASAAGFGMLLAGPRLRRALIALTLALLVVPPAALWVPRFVLFAEAGLTGTYVPLIAPAVMGTSPLFALLMHWSFRRIPRDLIDAGRLEGLGPVALWWKVGVPLTRASAFAVAALAFVVHWGNFIDPLLYLFDPAQATLPLGLRTLAQLKPTDFGVLMAASLVATLPAVLAFALVQRPFLASTRAGGWLGR